MKGVEKEKDGREQMQDIDGPGVMKEATTDT